MYRNSLELGDKEESRFTVNVFADVETGEEKFVTDSYSIAKAIKEAKVKYPEKFSELVFKIEFLGKTEVKGKPFNQFNISVCPLDIYEEYMKK